MPQKIYFLFGCKRSGNHAIINWLYKMIPNYVHLNNMNPNLFTSENYKVNLTTKPLQWNYIDRRWIPITTKNTLLVSFEDQDFKKTSVFINKFCQDLDYEPIIIILLRSPANNLASAYQVFNKNTNVLAKYVNLWQVYAQEYLNSTIFPNKVNLFYDKWFVNIEYRRELAHKLSLVFNDENFGKMYKHGISSFDKMKFMTDATKMDVLNRDKNFDTDERFTKLANNVKLLDIWNKIKEHENWKNKKPVT